LDTTTLAVPAELIADAGTAIVTWLAVTKVVVKAVPFQFALESLAKLDPLMVNVNPGAPWVAVAGTSCAIAGVTPAAGAMVAGDL
jgi:hypothetical protein